MRVCVIYGVPDISCVVLSYKSEYFLPMSKKYRNLMLDSLLYLIFHINNRIPYQMYVKIYRFGTLSRIFS